MITGYVWDQTNSFEQAFLYNNGVLLDLGSLDPTNAKNNTFRPCYHASGQIAGSGGTASGVNHAFLYSNGVMTDLGSLSGTLSGANALNDLGKLLGFPERMLFCIAGGT